MLKNIGQLMQQAQQVQTKMAEMQKSLEAEEIDGVAGGGMVSVTLNGKGAMRRIRIDPALLEPGEPGVLQDLILAAHNEARTKVETRTQERMAEVTGGLGLPAGMKLPF